MKKALKQFIIKFAPQFCSFAIILANIVTLGCRRSFYQPRDPNGLLEFAQKSAK